MFPLTAIFIDIICNLLLLDFFDIRASAQELQNLVFERTFEVDEAPRTLARNNCAPGGAFGSTGTVCERNRSAGNAWKGGYQDGRGIETCVHRHGFA